MGWRSWNAIPSITQSILENATAMMAERRSHPRNGSAAAQSFVDVGYTHIGLDGGSSFKSTWWSCTGVNKSHYNTDGKPIVNTAAYPDLSGWTKRATSLGMVPGWYMNVCKG